MAWNTSMPGADALAEVILAARTGIPNEALLILYSYSAAPTNGVLTITDGTTDLSVHITDAGPGIVHLPRGFGSDVNTAITVRLAAGGGVVAGKLNVQSQ